MARRRKSSTAEDPARLTSAAHAFSLFPLQVALARLCAGFFLGAATTHSQAVDPKYNPTVRLLNPP